MIPRTINITNGVCSSIAERRVVDPETTEHNRPDTPFLRRDSEAVKRSGL